jgi:hypothetical protein
MNWMRLGSIGLTTTLVTLLIAAGTLTDFRSAAQNATPTAGSLLAELGYPTLAVTTDGVVATVPADVEAGRYHVTFQNDGQFPSDLIIFQIPDGMTLQDLEPVLDEANSTGIMPPLLYDIVINGGAVAGPGEVGEVVLDLKAGTWGVSITSFDESIGEGTSAYESFTVSGDMPKLVDPEGATVMHLVDFDFVVPDNLVAGPQIVEVRSSGQPHHLVLMQVPDGATDEQVFDAVNTAFFTDPASLEAGATPVESAIGIEEFREVGYSSILSSGQVNWLAFDLPAGTYAALCFVPSPDGVPHVMMGMVEVFTVSEG